MLVLFSEKMCEEIFLFVESVVSELEQSWPSFIQVVNLNQVRDKNGVSILYSRLAWSNQTAETRR